MLLKFFAFFQETPILMNTKLVAAPASSEQKDIGKALYTTKTLLPPAKNTQLHSPIHIAR